MENTFLDSAPVLQILLKISCALRKPPSCMPDKKQEAEVSLNIALNPGTDGNCSNTIANLCYCPDPQQLNFPISKSGTSLLLQSSGTSMQGHANSPNTVGYRDFETKNSTVSKY